MEKELIKLTIYDLEKRVIKKPYYTEWNYPTENGNNITDSITENGKFNYEGLNEHEKMILYIYAWNISDFCASKKSIMKEFGWTSYKVSKMYRELKPYGLRCVPTFSENTGLLSGKGYSYY